jgi:hypothetical protein
MEDIDQENVQRILNEIDENGDGFVDENEFIKCLSDVSKACEGKPEILSLNLEAAGKSPTISNVSNKTDLITLASNTNNSAAGFQTNNHENPSGTFSQMMCEDSRIGSIAK